MNEYDAGSGSVAGGFKTIISMSLARGSRRGALFRQPEPICSFVSRGRISSVSVSGQSETETASGGEGERRAATCRQPADEGERGERDRNVDGI